MNESPVEIKNRFSSNNTHFLLTQLGPSRPRALRQLPHSPQRKEWASTCTHVRLRMQNAWKSVSTLHIYICFCPSPNDVCSCSWTLWLLLSSSPSCADIWPMSSCVRHETSPTRHTLQRPSYVDFAFLFTYFVFDGVFDTKPNGVTHSMPSWGQPWPVIIYKYIILKLIK